MGPKRGGKGKKGNKEKKELTDEEKVLKAQMLALKAEEARKKKEAERIARVKELQAKEEVLCKNSMRNIQAHWRKILRSSKVVELRKQIQLLAQEHEHQMDRRDTMVRTLRTDLVEAEAQQKMSYSNHLQDVDGKLDLHYVRTKAMDEDFQRLLKLMQKEFDTEKDYIVAAHTRHKQEMSNMMGKMEEEFNELRLEQHQEFEANREELKNKSAEEYNIMKLSLEGQIEELERRIESAHQQYLASTETKTQAFKELSVKDAIDSRMIEQRMRKLIHLHELLAMWRAKIATDSKKWDAANKALREEKDQINGHYQDLKRILARLHNSEHEKLKAISIASGNSTLNLKEKLDKAHRLIRLGILNSKFETEHEKVFPFDPLHCSTVPTVPVVESDEDIDAVNCRKRKNLSFFEESPLETAPHDAERDVVDSGAGLQLQPSLQHQQRGSRASVGSIPRLSLNAAPIAKAGPLETNATGIRLASHSVSHTGVEVAEVDYMDRFNKRINKVQLDKLNVEMEKSKLIEENHQLQSAVEIYLNGITVNDEALQGPLNTLLIVNRSLYQRTVGHRGLHV